MNNRLLLQQKLQASLEEMQSKRHLKSPLTDLQLDKTSNAEIAELTTELESCNPHPQPLVNAISLLNGPWKLLYSTAREIRSLDSLPLGLQLGEVYQVIDVSKTLFFNLAFVKHPLGIVAGYVKVTASFAPATDNLSPLPNQRINVNFDKRYLSIQKIFGFETPQLNPFKVIPAKGPQGRVPTLDITYLDENFRIGRGGDGSLFILTKADDLPQEFTHLED
ncbi:PAP/fibrillin family protein [Nodularia harveyana UHCC-0300]|uniref:PAP/fibrillin family protein n=1 Tax=Nodularia harveyana UHCC-0300 TaxID=2974287 RepID=A0ABU5UFU7_9CYAN|nr:PAP/fibrillin family protein [Nodularia harveyana]MEA5581970.1 PAP/fibrillin family protein [Nodularia harveyana UHCC-0300]